MFNEATVDYGIMYAQCLLTMLIHLHYSYYLNTYFRMNLSAKVESILERLSEHVNKSADNLLLQVYYFFFTNQHIIYSSGIILLYIEQIS